MTPGIDLAVGERFVATTSMSANELAIVVRDALRSAALAREAARPRAPTEPLARAWEELAVSASRVRAIIARTEVDPSAPGIEPRESEWLYCEQFFG